MENNIKQYLKFDEPNSLIYAVLYIFPLFYLDYHGILFFISAISITWFLQSKSGYAEIKDSVPFKFEKSLLLVIMIILIGFILLYLFYNGYLDKGLTINNIIYIPTYSTFYYYIVPLVWMVINNKNKLKEDFSFDIKKFKYTLIICSPIIIVNIGCVLLGINNINNPTKNLLIQNIFQFFITAALAEELFFRGYVYPIFKKSFNKPISQILSSVIFAIWHLGLVSMLFTNFSVLTLMNLIGICMLGIANTIIYDYSKSLIPCIVFHAVINGAFLNIMLLIKMQFI